MGLPSRRNNALETHRFPGAAHRLTAIRSLPLIPTGLWVPHIVRINLSALLSLLLENSLRSRQSCRGNPVGRAAYIVKPDEMAELHTLRLAAMLAADADLQVGSRLSSVLNANLHQPTDPPSIDNLERINRQYAPFT